MRTPPTPSGYALPLDATLTGYAHADGSLSLEDDDGRALDIPAPAVAALADLLRLSSNLRSSARRRVSRAQYVERYGDGE